MQQHRKKRVDVVIFEGEQAFHIEFAERQLSIRQHALDGIRALKGNRRWARILFAEAAHATAWKSNDYRPALDEMVQRRRQQLLGGAKAAPGESFICGLARLNRHTLLEQSRVAVSKTASRSAWSDFGRVSSPITRRVDPALDKNSAADGRA